MNKKAAGYTFLGLILLYIVLILVFLITGCGDNLSTLSVLVLSESLIVIPALCVTFIMKKDESCLQIWGFKKISAVSVLCSPIFAALITPVGILMNLITMQIVDNTFVSASDSILEMPYIVAVLAMGVFGPLCEEIAFRGVIYNSMKRSGCGIAAVIVSSLMFGLMHMNLNQFAYAFVLGISFVIINEATGSIWPSVICHMCYNTFNVSLMFLVNLIIPGFYDSDIAQEASSSMNFPVALIIYLVMAVGCGVLAYLLLCGLSKKEGRSDYFKNIKMKTENPLTVCSIIGMVIAVLFIIYDTISIVLGM